MRLNRLDLIRYGRFTDAQIAFPRPDGDAPDVTVVFGPNEAGKSTAFNAFLELLFGFKGGAHPYAFRHERRNLLVGAELDIPNRGTMDLRRNSTSKQSLLDGEARPLNEAILSGALYGLDRDSYEERFSIDETRLREGGKRIAEAHGDLGELLHAGLSGLTGISQMLDDLTTKSDAFHKKHGRGTRLRKGTDRLKELWHDLREDRLTTEREHKLSSDLKRAANEFGLADKDLRRARHRMEAAKAAQFWYEQTQKMDQLTEKLADYPDGPALQPNTAEHVASLIEKIVAGKERIKEIQEDISRQDQIISDNPSNESADRLEAELIRLDQLEFDGAPLIGRGTSAQADLAKRQGEVHALTERITTALGHLALTEVPAAIVISDDDGFEELGSAVQSCLDARNAAISARNAVEIARAQQGEQQNEPRDLSALRTAFDHWNAIADMSGPVTEYSNASERLIKATANLPKAWKTLTDAGLLTLEALEEITQKRSQTNADLSSTQDDLEARHVELTTAQDELSDIQATPEIVDLAQTEDTRRERDLAWQSHKNDLCCDTAKKFETAMYADDHARAYYQTGTEARERLRTAQGRLRAAKNKYRVAKERHDDLIAARDNVAARCKAAARSLGLAENTPPSAFAARHQALTTAAEAAAELSVAQGRLEKRKAKRQEAYDSLASAAHDVGIQAKDDELTKHTQQALILEESVQRAWEKWQKNEAEIATLDDALQRCKTASQRAQEQLDQLASDLPLADRSAENLRSALPHLRSIQKLHGESVRLSERITNMEGAIKDLADGARRLARIMGTSESDAADDPVQTIDRARLLVKYAQQADQKRIEAASRLDDLKRAKDRAETGLKTAQSDLCECFRGQGCDDLPPKTRIEKLTERDRLRTEKDTADRARKEARQSVDEDLFVEELEIAPSATREAELGQELSDAQTRRDDALGAKNDAERLYDEAFQAADRSDLATERATLIAELQNEARKAAVARLAVLTARGALRKLAEEKSSSMLSDVSEAFVTMTAPNWTGVKAWTQREGEKLVGLQPDGTPVPVDAMSTGTMGQLYFALRLAGYRSFASDPGPLPMILDDIMETFDDTRAKAALQLCAEIGRSGQAILFTHHAHLVDLARQSISGLSIQNMPE